MRRRDVGPARGRPDLRVLVWTNRDDDWAAVMKRGCYESSDIVNRAPECGDASACLS